MSRHREQKTAELDVVDFLDNGNGLAYLEMNDGRRIPVEVPFTMPGDKVRVLLLNKRRGRYASRILEILVPAPERIQPRCIHFGVCGGCRWQHVPYVRQLQLKEALICRLFDFCLTSKVDLRPIIGCDPPWHYRNKMEFTFSSNAAKEHFLGLIMNGNKGRTFHLTECHLVHEWFVTALKATNIWWNETKLDAYHPLKNTGSLRTLTMREGRRTGDRMIILTVSGNPEYALTKAQTESFVAYMRDALEPLQTEGQLSLFLRIHQAIKGTKTNFYEMLLYGPDHIREIMAPHLKEEEPANELTLRISPLAFFQPNTPQAEILYSLAFQIAKITKDTIVYDLYSGTGTLALCAAKLAKQVLAIELSPEAILDARENMEVNGVTNVTLLTGDVGKLLHEIKKEQSYPMPDLVMVDPPRAGLDSKAIEALIEIRPPKILYISCNPKTQAENVAELQKSGYAVEVIQPVDQFPQTPHVENIVLLALPSQV